MLRIKKAALVMLAVLVVASLPGCSGVPPTTGRIIGTVTSNQQPISGAEVMLFVADNAVRVMEPNYLTTTGADGAFSISNITPGPYTVGATAEIENVPYSTGLMTSILVSAGETELINLVLNPILK